MTVKIDATGYVAAVKDFQTRHLPFAMAKTLTNVAQDAQKEVQRNATRAFTLRSNWARQGIRIKPAAKAGVGGIIQADVHTHRQSRLVEMFRAVRAANPA